MMRIARRGLMLIGWSVLALGCNGSCNDPASPAFHTVDLQASIADACKLSAPDLEAEGFDAPIQQLNLPPSPQLLAVQDVRGEQQKYFFIMPSLAPGSYPLPSTFVSYTASTGAPSASNPPKVWQARNGTVQIGTCTNGSKWIVVDDTLPWVPAAGSTATGTWDPGLVYGRLP